MDARQMSTDKTGSRSVDTDGEKIRNRKALTVDACADGHL